MLLPRAAPALGVIFTCRVLLRICRQCGGVTELLLLVVVGRGSSDGGGSQWQASGNMKSGCTFISWLCGAELYGRGDR